MLYRTLGKLSVLVDMPHGCLEHMPYLSMTKFLDQLRPDVV